LIREWNRELGVTVFLTSHDAGDIEHVAERVIVINCGRVVLDDRVNAVRRQYLGSKVLRVQFQEQPVDFSMPGLRVIQRSGYELKLEVDSAVTPVAAVIEAILRAAPIADIAVEDPPLEEVIARIYTSTSQSGGSS
jgi:ABC-2 type transport system ATP-binding protein